MKVEPLLYGDRKVFTVAGFNRGVADWLARLPTLWIEGEVTELRRNDRWGSVFFTLKDPDDGACLPASIPRRTFDALKLDLAEGERIHVLGRAELFAAKGEFRLRALSLERFGLGAHLAAIERLKQTLAAEGLFDAARKRPLPRFPRRIGLVTGSDAAARRDVITTIQTRFPPARVLVAETLVQGPRAAAGIVEALQAIAREPGIDVVVLTRGGGSFDDLLPFSDERSCEPSPRVPCRSSRRSGTSRTRRSAISQLTCARRRRRPRASSSSPISRRCGSSSTAPAARSNAACGGRSFANARVSLARGPLSSAVPAGRSSATSSGWPSSGTGSGAGLRSSSSGAGRCSTGPPAASQRSPRVRRSDAATQSCEQVTRFSAALPR